MKLINLLILSLLLLSQSISAEVKVTWLGVAGLKITDDQTCILIDPVFTKPNLSHWLFNTKFKSNKSLVKNSLKKAQIEKCDAIFSSHTHFDHAIDITQIAIQTNAVTFGGISLKRLFEAEKNDFIEFKLIGDQEEINIGNFKIIAYRREHAAIIHSFSWKFLPGEIQKDFNFNFYDYKEGETWSYRIEHPKARLLFDQGSHFFELNNKYKDKTEAYLLGIMNKKSLNELIENNIDRINSPLIIPIHFDFFLFQSNYLESKWLPGNDLLKIKDILMNRNQNKINFHIPNLFEEIIIPTKNE